jgi:hypothetical protein
VYASNPSVWEAEAGESPVQGQPGLHSETLSLETNQPNQKLTTVPGLGVLRLRSAEVGLWVHSVFLAFLSFRGQVWWCTLAIWETDLNAGPGQKQETLSEKK